MREAAMGEVEAEAINPSRRARRAAFWSSARAVFRFIPVCIGVSLESLESAFFFLRRATISNTDSAASPRGLPVFHDCLFLQRP